MPKVRKLSARRSSLGRARWIEARVKLARWRMRPLRGPLVSWKPLPSLPASVARAVQRRLSQSSN